MRITNNNQVSPGDKVFYIDEKNNMQIRTVATKSAVKEKWQFIKSPFLSYKLWAYSENYWDQSTPFWMDLQNREVYLLTPTALVLYGQPQEGVYEK